MAQRLDKTVLLPEAHFILEADLDRGRRRKFAHGLRNTSGKVFLNATIACASSSPYWVLAASRQLLLAGDSTRDYESGGQEFESLRARTFGTVVLAEPGRYCAQPCHTLIASLSNTACAGAPLLYRFRTGRQIRDRHLGELDEMSGHTRRNPDSYCPQRAGSRDDRESRRGGNNIVPAHEIPPQTFHALPRLARLGSRRRAEYV